jgi:undecaprenyl-diphosphatase
MLAIPALGIIFLSEIIALGFTPSEINWLDILLVSTFSFLSSYLCIGIFLNLIERIGFAPFVIYRVLLGIFLLFLAY